jgi:hypothetical protein
VEVDGRIIHKKTRRILYYLKEAHISLRNRIRILQEASLNVLNFVQIGVCWLEHLKPPRVYMCQSSGYEAQA